MSLSRIYLPSISLVLEAKQHSFIPEPSSVIIPVDDSLSSSHAPVDPDFMKPVNLGREEFEGDEHFSFVVQFPEGLGLEVREEYDEVGQIVQQQKRPSTSRGLPGHEKKSFVPQRTDKRLKPYNISAWRNAFRKVYPALIPTTLRRKVIQH